MNFVSRLFSRVPPDAPPTIKEPPRVLVIVITNKSVEPACYESILAQDHPSFSVLVHVMRPVKHVGDPATDRFHNIARNLNAVRIMALASGCSHFLFVDSDIVLPGDAISSLVSHRKDIIGGWYRMIETPLWVAGCWVADNTLHHAFPGPSVTKVDMVGHGCMLLSRRALQALIFEAGFDKVCHTEVGDCFLGPCAAFGNLAESKGFNLYMDGHVICGHIDRKTGIVVGNEELAEVTEDVAAC